jgi:primase-polymerase (primpol)-like protein
MGETNKAAPEEQPQESNVSKITNTTIPHLGAERLSLNIELIPEELKQRNQWVLWRLEERNDKTTKIPYTTKRKHASSTDAETWTSFDSAFDFYKGSNGYFNGIGYVFSSDDPFTGIDLDKCISEGNLTDEAKAIVKELSSYTERSQSKNGLHTIIKAVLPGNRNRTGNIEMYDTGRFFAMTGDHILHTPETIEERQSELNSIYKENIIR